jgi:uncharacterized pyridoxamine 5'-phosphate oxidase family protein
MNNQLGDFKEDLAKLKILHARMLYMIYYLSKTNDINYSQKNKLKQLVIQENPILIKIYNNFERSFNLQKLVSEWTKAFFEEVQTNISTNSPEKQTIDVKSLSIRTDKQSLKKPQKDENNEIKIIHSTPDNDIEEVILKCYSLL